jgi:hypothetical protein
MQQCARCFLHTPHQCVVECYGNNQHVWARLAALAGRCLVRFQPVRPTVVMSMSVSVRLCRGVQTCDCVTVRKLQGSPRLTGVYTAAKLSPIRT